MAADEGDDRDESTPDGRDPDGGEPDGLAGLLAKLARWGTGLVRRRAPRASQGEDEQHEREG